VSRVRLHPRPMSADRLVPHPVESEPIPCGPSARSVLVVTAGQPSADLSVGIVVYRSDPRLLRVCLERLGAAVREAGLSDVDVFVIDNGPAPEAGAVAREVEGCAPSAAPCTVSLLSGHGNLGYGRGNNLAIERTRASHHLVLNPDAELEPDALRVGLSFLSEHPEAGMVAAMTVDGAGRVQPLVKTYPSVAVLAIRAFGLKVGAGLRRAYDVSPEPGGVTDVTGALVSGSFMLCRTELLRRVGGFDPGYFLYFEDFDLSLRMARVARLFWLRDLRVVHHGGGAARKGWLHRGLFARGAWRFFSTHGWRWW
jgi:GT2 family glycosyltransferase